MKRLDMIAIGAVYAAGLGADLPASAAVEAPPFTAFQMVCLTPDADFSKVKAATAQGGWRDTEVTGAAPFPGVVATAKIAKATKVGGEPLTLYAYTGSNKAGVHFSECQMRVAKPDFDALNVAAAAYAGFASQDSAPKKTTYRFTPTASGVAAVDKTGFDAAASSAGLDILTVSGDTHGALIGLLKIKK